MKEQLRLIIGGKRKSGNPPENLRYFPIRTVDSFPENLIFPDVSQWDEINTDDVAALNEVKWRRQQATFKPECNLTMLYCGERKDKQEPINIMEWR